MKTKLIIGIFIWALMILVSGSNTEAKATIGKAKMGKEYSHALKQSRQINKKWLRFNELKKAPKWKKWKNSNDQKHFH